MDVLSPCYDDADRDADLPQVKRRRTISIADCTGGRTPRPGPSQDHSRRLSEGSERYVSQSSANLYTEDRMYSPRAAAETLLTVTVTHDPHHQGDCMGKGSMPRGGGQYSRKGKGRKRWSSGGNQPAGISHVKRVRPLDTRMVNYVPPPDFVHQSPGRIECVYEPTPAHYSAPPVIDLGLKQDQVSRNFGEQRDRHDVGRVDFSKPEQLEGLLKASIGHQVSSLIRNPYLVEYLKSSSSDFTSVSHMMILFDNVTSCKIETLKKQADQEIFSKMVVF